MKCTSLIVMIRAIRSAFPALLITTLIFAPLTSVANADSSAREPMPYELFSLAEASEPYTPLSPYADIPSSEEGTDRRASFEEWWFAMNARQGSEVPGLDRLRAFTKESARLVLAESGEANALFSPVNTWLYLELLSRLTTGESRAQILDALGTEPGSVPADDAIYKALYWDDGVSICRPSSSIWIGQRTRISDALAVRLAATCHTSVFQGPMGAPEFNKAFRSWLNERTNHLMEGIVNGLGFDSGTGISLCTTLYLRCLWSQPFFEEATAPDVFYAPGGETTADFMRKEDQWGAVYLGDGFSSVILNLQSGGYVTLVLPDSGGSVGEIVRSEDCFDFLFAGREWTQRQEARVKLSMPKTDILTAMPMNQLLVRMGVTDILDPTKLEFSEDITSDDDLKLSSIDQYSRLIMNEDGVEAASIIVSDTAALPAPSEEIDFILNRPFLFAVFSETNIPLFIGVYNSP